MSNDRQPSTNTNWSAALEARLSRMESRLVQLMLHFGLDPYSKTYSAQHPEQHHTSDTPTPEDRNGNRKEPKRN